MGSRECSDKSSENRFLGSRLDVVDVASFPDQVRSTIGIAIPDTMRCVVECIKYFDTGTSSVPSRLQPSEESSVVVELLDFRHVV